MNVRFTKAQAALLKREGIDADLGFDAARLAYVTKRDLETIVKRLRKSGFVRRNIIAVCSKKLMGVK